MEEVLHAEDFEYTPRLCQHQEQAPHGPAFITSQSCMDGLGVGTGKQGGGLWGGGFSPKRGDGGVDLSPIGDLFKSEVQDLALVLGIDEEIVLQAPTDGLWEDGRTDEDQLQMSYEDLEKCIEGGICGRGENGSI